MPETEKVEEYHKFKKYSTKFRINPGYSDYTNSDAYAWDH